MRITGGELRGRVVRAPRRGIRPASDRVREALFSSLADRVGGARVLDLFAGSGAYGLEAWSRGAASVCWVEQDRQVFRILRQNVEALCGGDSAACTLCNREVGRFLAGDAARMGPFDLVVADPPYGPGEEGEGWLGKLLRILGDRPILSESGRLVMEQGAREPVPDRGGWDLVKNKTYGGTRLLQYVQTVPAGEKGSAT